MRKGLESFLDVQSPSWIMVSNLLWPLESPHNLLVTDPNQSSSSLQLSVTLPRYGLSFFVDEDGNLQSRNIHSMIYDENQSVRTLFGLVNWLVLRPKHRDNGRACPSIRAHSGNMDQGLQSPSTKQKSQ